ncbi:hypothetical protein TRFO_29601 [Tritrichomonas foetus]|uniref:Uncharacterized protein n=1 Tax=Tritrichomonas foetus TaxID=1144522 RepID=A0A1J4JWN8_9EUKA|nr:hypothetical protein TRFO_29601 [Tritrichomonas foetus]|eukprot:OHT03082.1 hypothetical protein TRFO_29601 [Tritrichomonas foetus]
MSSSLFHELSAFIKKTQQLFQTKISFQQMIEISLKISYALTYEASFEQYAELHSQCIAFYGVLRQKIVDMHLDKNEIEDGFYLALSAEKIIPRLYVALVIACSVENDEYLDIIIKMLISVTHPLRGFMLRFTAISLFPMKSPKLPDFAYQNFLEMLYLIPKFNNIFEIGNLSVFDAICGWLSSNISISLFAANFQTKYIQIFLMEAEKVYDDRIKLSIVSSVAQTIPHYSIVENIDAFASIFRSLEVSEESVHSILFICSRSRSAKDSFLLVSKTKFSLICSQKITQMAIMTRDYEAMVMCMNEWKENDDIILMIYNEIGIHKFSRIIPNFIKSSQILLNFFNDVDSLVPKEAIRKMFRFLDSFHSVEIELAIDKMLKRVSKIHKFDNFLSLNTLTNVFGNILDKNDENKYQMNDNKDQMNENKDQMNKNEDQMNENKYRMNKNEDQMNENKDQMNKNEDQINENKNMLNKNREIQIELLDDKNTSEKENYLFDNEFILQLFDENFVFKTKQLFLTVISFLSKGEVDFERLLRYIDQASAIDQTIQIQIMCQIWPVGKTDEFFERIQNYNLSQFELAIIYSVFPRLNLTQEKYLEFASKSEEKVSLLSLLKFSLIFKSSQFSIHSDTIEVMFLNKQIEQTLIKLCKLDGNFIEIRERLHLYLDVIEVICEFGHEFRNNDTIQQTLEEIFGIIYQVIQFMNNFSQFPIDSDIEFTTQLQEKLKKWKSSSIFQNYGDKIELIAHCIENYNSL